MNNNAKFLLFSFALSFVFFAAVNKFQQDVERFFYAQITKPLENVVLADFSTREEKPAPELDVVAAGSFKINKWGRQKSVLKINSRAALPIASLSKLMTAVIAIEDYDLSRIAQVSTEAALQYDVPVCGNLDVGQRLSVLELLELMLHCSSNDAAYALSEIMGGEKFVAAMNDKARELKLNNTYFVNATGLDPEDSGNEIPNYSSVSDLVALSKYILSVHPDIFEISVEKNGYSVENGVFDLALRGNTIIGGKTGYTERAGGCMLSVLQNENGIYFINVVLGAESPQTRVYEMQKLINWLNQ